MDFAKKSDPDNGGTILIPLWDNIFKSDRKLKTIESSLRQNILFKELSPRELSLVRQIVNVRNYAAGEAIFHQGEVGVGMYIILKGRIDITVEETMTPGGPAQSRFVTKLTDGDFFGEIALVEETGRRTATATAQTESTLIGFFKPDLFEILGRNPTAGVKILMALGQVLGTRLAETTALLRQMRQSSAPS